MKAWGIIYRGLLKKISMRYLKITSIGAAAHPADGGELQRWRTWPAGNGAVTHLN